MRRKLKLCLLASSGGHYEQLLMLRPLLEHRDGFVMTEKTPYLSRTPGTRYLIQVNRREWLCPLKMLANCFLSLWALLRERPNVVICTGALATIPMCLLVKLTGGRLIFIESFAKSSSPTLTGRFLYRFADRCYVQWPGMLEFYPNAICLGGIY